MTDEQKMSWLSGSQISGQVIKRKFFSPILGVEKHYNVYLPSGYEQSSRRYPVLYLFRGHEDEWFNPYQDHSRGGEAVQHLADDLIQRRKMGEMLIVGVGLTSDDGQVQGLGVNFLNPRAAKKYPGVGSGRFEDYFVHDLIPHIDATFRTIADREHRGADGFSLGGYTAVMLAVKHPDLFGSVGCYDGSHMFRNLDDPRLNLTTNDDPLWVRTDDMFAPAFRKPRRKKYDIDHLLSYNALNLLEQMSPDEKARVQSIHFYITSAAFDGFQGNRDRAIHLMTLFALHGIENRADSLILSNDAHHNWKFADLHLRLTLPRHSQYFGITPQTKVFEPRLVSREHLKILTVHNSLPVNRNIEVFYRINKQLPVKIEVLNTRGERVTVLRNDLHLPGKYRISWDGNDREGRQVTSDVYFIQFCIPEGALQEKVIFLR